eukprot:gene13045-8891_t
MAYIISHIRNSLQTRKFKTITTTKVHNIKYKVNSTSWPAKAQKYLRIKQPTVITKLQGDLHVNHKSNLAAHKLKETNSSLQTTNPSLIIYSLKTLNTVQRKAQQRYNHINHPTVCVSQQLQTTLAHSTDSCDRHSTVNLYNITTNQPLSNAIVTPYTNSVVHNNKRIKPKQPTNQLQILANWQCSKPPTKTTCCSIVNRSTTSLHANTVNNANNKTSRKDKSTYATQTKLAKLPPTIHRLLVYNARNLTSNRLPPN